jgi:23S rRNA (uridine2552-2'-O)-methyltransferase
MGRGKTSNVWMKQHVRDTYVQRAKADGWRSRAVYKLIELDEKDHLFRPGQTVVDLGAAPGSWSQLAMRRVGSNGRVIALDLLEMEPIHGVVFLPGDFTENELLDRLEKALAPDGKGSHKVDLVISDMAPNLTGIAAGDQARGIGLVEMALEFALQWLKPEGAFVVKVFHGAGFEEFRRAMQASFEVFAVRKPEASRDRSSEVYLVGRRPKL